MKKNQLNDLYVQYRQALFLYALSLTRHPSDAEDLVSTTFMKAILSFDERKGDFKAWLFVVLKHQFIDAYRKRKHESYQDFLQDTLQDPYDASKHYIKNEQKRWLYSKIYALPLKEKSIMLLTIAGLNDAFIASYTNQSVDNVRTIRYLIKKQLKELAKKEGYL